MATPETPRAAAQHLTSAELRHLWEQGHRGPAIHAALEGWEHLMRAPDDLDWLEGALRSSGLAAEAFAVQLESTRRRARVPAWEGLIRSLLHSRDPWWARELLAEAGGDSRELQALRIE